MVVSSFGMQLPGTNSVQFPVMQLLNSFSLLLLVPTRTPWRQAQATGPSIFEGQRAVKTPAFWRVTLSLSMQLTLAVTGACSHRRQTIPALGCGRGPAGAD